MLNFENTCNTDICNVCCGSVTPTRTKAEKRWYNARRSWRRRHFFGTFANIDLAAQLFVLGCRSGKSTVSPSSGYGQHVVALQHALISHYISKQRVATSTVLVSWISGSFCAILSSIDFGICDWKRPQLDNILASSSTLQRRLIYVMTPPVYTHVLKSWLLTAI